MDLIFIFFQQSWHITIQSLPLVIQETQGDIYLVKDRLIVM